MQKSGKDVIYSQPQNKIENFTFDHTVAEVFPGHDPTLRSRLQHYY